MTMQQESILVVDDDVDVLSALEAELQDDFEITAVTGVEQALAQLQCRAFSAIISDVRMPGVDGLSLIRQCAVRYPRMVRIILTAFDGDDVHETALGPHGAYKLLKPWGDDLLIILQNALKQRKSTVELRRHLDLKSELLDIDRRLHTALDTSELMHEATYEMMRIPEVVTAAAYIFDEEGTATVQHVFRTNADDVIPEIREARSTPVPYKGQYLYSVPIGEWSKPWAVIALRLTNTESDTIRYVDFISRQAYRTLLLIRALPAPGARVTHYPPQEYNASEGNVAASWMLKELTTPATVLASAHHGLNRLAKILSGYPNRDDQLARTAHDLSELTDDLASISNSLSTLLNQLKTINEKTPDVN
ncbi:MAG: response regulator [Deltaproteobacteria bacterium]|nr:response regulator [Deltaproteobacteria bacterium]